MGEIASASAPWASMSARRRSAVPLPLWMVGQVGPPLTTGPSACLRGPSKKAGGNLGRGVKDCFASLAMTVVSLPGPRPLQLRRLYAEVAEAVVPGDVLLDSRVEAHGEQRPAGRHLALHGREVGADEQLLWADEVDEAAQGAAGDNQAGVGEAGG